MVDGQVAQAAFTTIAWGTGGTVRVTLHALRSECDLGGALTCDAEGCCPDGADAAAEPDEGPPDIAAVPKTYAAVYIQDLWDGKATSCGSIDVWRMSPGADIDAIELLYGTVILGNVETVRGSVNSDGTSQCMANAFTDFSRVKGTPDATKNFDGNYVSLEGGWLIAKFTGAVDIQVGDTLKVYELGKSSPIYAGGNDVSEDEPYEVWLATDIACVDEPNFESTCMWPLTAEAVGASTIPVTAF